MKQRSHRQDNSADEARVAADELLSLLFKQAKARFGDAIKSFWFYDGDFCPGCSVRPIDTMKIKGKDAVAINSFIYRPRSVLIGYFLCGTCATYIHAEAKKNPYKETPMHADIERNLITGYHKHLKSLNA
jgi:hypothetical protein